VVLSEAPTFLGTVRMMKNMGVDIEGVPLDENGVRVDALEAILKRLKAAGKRAKMFYVIPTFQNPSGVTTTLERRQRIVELAREYDFVILEDDAYYDLRFAGDPLPPLYALEGGVRTFYVGTFSKILSPGLRLGFVVANEDVIAHLEALKPEGGASPFAMAVAWEFCKNGGLDANIAKLSAAYKRRCETMQDALTEFMPTGVTWTQPQGGFFIWVTLPDYMDAREMDAAVRAKGVDYLPGAACFFDGSGNNTLRLAFSYAAEDKLAEGIQAIAECVRERVR
jgi:2-aminoadipate transaminase